MSLDSLRAFALATDPYRMRRAPTRTSCLKCDEKASVAVADLKAAARENRRTRTTDPFASSTRAAQTQGATMTPVISTSGIKKRYELGKNNHVHALRGASVEIDRGEMVAIVGPSGSGKSTLMHLIGCLDTPDWGEVHVNGRRVDNLRGKQLTRVRSREIGFIFQGFNLVPTMSALDNVALAAEYAGVIRSDATARARKLLDLVGLGDRKGHLPSELSGGQQQRVAIARALVNKPAIVLGDEPTGDLDTATSDEIIALMRKINTETGTTFVLVTHNPEVAAACDRTISMRDGLVADAGYAPASDDETCCTSDAKRGRRFLPNATPVGATA